MFLIRFAFILLLIFFILRLVSKFFLKTYINNAKRNFEQQQQNYHSKQKKEGDVTINTQSDKNKKIKKDEGDYVDYEEVDK